MRQNLIVRIAMSLLFLGTAVTRVPRLSKKEEERKEGEAEEDSDWVMRS